MDSETGNYELFHQGPCNCISYNDGLWIGQKSELLYSPGTAGTARTVYTCPPEYGEITAVFRSDSGDVWIGTSLGRLIHSAGDLSAPWKEEIPGKVSSRVQSIFEDSRGTVWVGTLHDGAVSISKNGKITVYRHDSAISDTISSNYVRDFCEDNLGNIWIGTFTGLDCLNCQTGDITRYLPETIRHDAISHSSVWALSKDSQGTIWVGTYYGGVNYFNPEYNIYNRYAVSRTEGNGLSSSIVSKIITDNEGNLWIATEGGGLNYLDRRTGKTKWYNTTAPAGRRLSENNIKDMIFVPEENALYLGIHLGGVNRIDLNTGRINTYMAGKMLPSDDVLNLADYGDSLIVLMKTCTSIMDKKTGQCRTIRPMEGYKHLQNLFVDKDNNIWFSKMSPNRLFRLPPPYTKEIEYTRDNVKGDFCTSKITGMMQDASGKIWIATIDSGLYVYSDDTFTSLGGDIPLKMAGCMTESPSSGNIICSSNDGFVIFNPITHNAVQYGKGNGFPLRNSLTQCITVTDDSEIFIGGQGGLVSVEESDLNIQTKPYRLFFTSLSVNGEKQEAGSDILPNPILNTTSITFPSSTKSIELYFSSSNHISANHDPTEYRLEGFEQHWNQVKKERKISYTNLPSGKYRLVVRPIQSVSEDICQPIFLNIRILAPWYATWPAICIYILLITIAIYLILKFYANQVQMRESARLEKERANDLENLNQAKLRFFTNISHEIRTPLTIIIAEIESIIQSHNFSPALYRKVLGIYKNSLSLRELVSELMEFRKQEQGHLKIRVAPHNIVFFINEFHLLFSEYAASKGIRLSFTKDTERLEVWYDQIQMQKVLNNILANSIKFTPEGGSVTIRTYSTEASAVIEIKDTGRGIPEKDLKNIFNRFYQVESSPDINTGTGIGLALAQGIVSLHHGTIEVESSEGNGSLFRIILPLGYSHFSKEQLDDSQTDIAGLSLSDKITIPEDRPETEAETDTEPAKTGHTVVIAEDNQGILDMLVKLFSPIYKVVTATDGASALNAVRKHLPSLVVSDVLMPVMSGTRLCKMIKTDPTLCHIPVVLLTARVEVEQNMEGLQQGADDYITKPFNSALLLSRCNNLVNSRIILQEKYGKQTGTASWVKATNRLDNDFLDRITGLINENLDDVSFDIDELIKSVGMSRTGFFRKLKAITGQTPSELILSIRLRKGADLLRFNPEMNISEISDAIGFNTPKYFAKCFKEHYGKSPLAWRKDATETK